MRIACTANTYNEDVGAVSDASCRACPVHAVSGLASALKAHCECDIGYYDERANASAADGLVMCSTCPIGAVCGERGTSLLTLPLEPGYWRTQPTSNNLLRCPDATAATTSCLGGASADALCKPWTTGPYCQLCNVTDGSRYFDELESSCQPCTGDGASTARSLILGGFATMALLLLGLLLLCRRQAAKGPSHSALYRWYLLGLRHYHALSLRNKAKQLVTLYQILVRLDDVFEIPMPPDVASLLSSLDVVSLNPASFGLPLGCVGLTTFYDNLLFATIAPVALVMLVTAASVVVACCQAHGMALSGPGRRMRGPVAGGGGDGMMTSPRARLLAGCRAGLLRALPTALLVSFLAFPMATNLALRAFSCKNFDDGSSHLRVDLSVDCNDDATHGPIKRLATAAIVIYPIGIPLWYMVMLRAARGAILSGRATTLSRALAFLHQDIEPRCLWWEVAEIAKKTFLLGAVALIKPGTSLQLIVGFGFSLVFMLLSSIVDPYRQDSDDFFALVCNFVLTASLFLCFVLKVDVLTEQVSAPATSFLASLPSIVKHRPFTRHLTERAHVGGQHTHGRAPRLVHVRLGDPHRRLPRRHRLRHRPRLLPRLRPAGGGGADARNPATRDALGAAADAERRPQVRRTIQRPSTRTPIAAAMMRIACMCCGQVPPLPLAHLVDRPGPVCDHQAAALHASARGLHLPRRRRPRRHRCARAVRR